MITFLSGAFMTLCMAMTRTGSRAFMRQLWLSLLLVTALLGAPAAWAGSISISITPTVEWANGVLTVKVKVSNSGDEPAQTVLPRLRFRDQVLRGTGKPTVNPGETFEETLTLQAPGLGQGRWPYRLDVDYADLNQHPFQALQVGVVTVGVPEPTKFSLRMEPVKLADLNGSTTTMNIVLNNSAAAPREVTVAVIVPDGVDVSDQPKPSKVDAGKETTARATLVSRDVLAGSRYPIFVTAEYDADGIHHGVYSQGMLEIVPNQSALTQNREVFWVAAGVAVALWVGVLVWRVAARRSVAPQA